MAFPETHDFTYYKGDTYNFDVALKNKDGSVHSLTPYELVEFKIANQRGSAGTKITGYAVKGDNGVINCKILPSVGRSLTAGTAYVYDVQITDETPNPDIIYTVLTGTITVIDDIIGS